VDEATAKEFSLLIHNLYDGEQIQLREIWLIRASRNATGLIE